jgi:uncharacterized CHY-type Zn-finger protein
MSSYIDALKKKGSKEITFATPRSSVQKAQGNKCFKCKKSLRPGMFKMIKDPQTKENHIICSDCLVHVAEKKY